MDIKGIHFIREVLVTNWQGKPTPLMQFSYANASFLDPPFQEVPSTDQEQVRELYLELGGRRLENERIGSTVVIPNRTRWGFLRGTS